MHNTAIVVFFLSTYYANIACFDSPFVQNHLQIAISMAAKSFLSVFLLAKTFVNSVSTYAVLKVSVSTNMAAELLCIPIKNEWEI